MARVTVIVPVFNRRSELSRALTSLKNQSFTDFECLVVDDASSVPIEPVVKAMNDNRFVYLRSPQNGGPYNARFFGYRHMRGEYLFQLDSDWEAFPWALAQGVHYLDSTPEVDAVAGMHLVNEESRMLGRVPHGAVIIDPDSYKKSGFGVDCAGMVRRSVVEEWLHKRADYFAMEFHQWFTFGLHRSQLYVDEPWVRYHVDGSDRVSLGLNARQFSDYMKFMEEHAEQLLTVRAPFLAQLLFEIWFQLLMTGRRQEASRAYGYLRLQNISIWREVCKKILKKVGKVIRSTFMLKSLVSKTRVFEFKADHSGRD